MFYLRMWAAVALMGLAAVAIQADDRNGLGKGINLGNMLEAPAEGEWGSRFKDPYAKTIRQAGFDHVRFPVKWSAHARKEAPYELDRLFKARVQHIVRVCTEQGLKVVLNVHHYDEIYERPDDHAARLVGIWKQIATEFRDAPETVYFELLNEPHSALSDERWNALFPQILREVRALHPQRPVIVGPSQWNSHANLQNMKLPADDRNLIVTFHYYLPFEFTHQQAEWLGKDAPPAHRPFPAKESEVDMIELHFERAAKWAKEQQRPLYLGEFGAYHKADLPARVAWTKLVRKTAEEHGIDWAYWEFCSGFGAYDPERDAWIPELRDALTGP